MAEGIITRRSGGFRGVAATGGTVTDISQDGQLLRVHTFTSDGAFEVTRGGEVDILVVGGGGAGAQRHGGGGGAGGMVEAFSVPVQNISYSITVAGGSLGSLSDGSDVETTTSVSNSTALGLTAVGGGSGAISDVPGRPGGSGSGARTSSPGEGLQPTQSQPAGLSVFQYGNRGGFGHVDTQSGGGGGGAGQVGGDGTGPQVGKGGDGRQSNISGVNTFYAGGGAGAGREADHSSGQGAPNIGGLGGGGSSRRGSLGGEDGHPNTGGGGGGSHDQNNPRIKGGDGGSGIVIIRYRIG